MNWPPLRRHGEALLLTVICLGFVALEIAAVMKDSPLGHDESVYSAEARQIAIGGARAPWFLGYRAPGLPWLLAHLPIGFGEARFRMVIVAFGVLAIVLTWYIGRMLAGPAVGVTAALATALSPVHMAASSLVLPDIPAVAVELLVVTVLMLALRRPRLPWWAWAIVPLSAGATWIRFGAPVAIGVYLAAVVLSRWDRVRPQLGRVVALGVATLSVCVAILAVPALTGSDASALAALGQRQAGRNRFLFESLPDFRALAPAALGPWPLWLAIAALVLAIVALLSRTRRLPPGAGLSLGIVVGTIVTLAWSLPHGEGRYLAPAIPWACIGAAAVLVPLVREFRPIVLWVGVAITLAVMPEAALNRMHTAHDKQLTHFDVLREAGAVVRESAAYPCPVVSSYSPQIQWYTGCETYAFDDGEIPSRLDGRAFSIVFVQKGKRQPDREELTDVIEDASASTVVGDKGKRALSQVWIYGIDGADG